jgi:hypothetical protein
MSVDFQWAAHRYILEVRTLHDHGCENLKSYIVLLDDHYNEKVQQDGLMFCE